MTDPFPSSDADHTTEDATSAEGDVDGVVGDPAVEGLVLGDLGTPGAGDATFAGLENPPVTAFYTHSGTPCG